MPHTSHEYNRCEMSLWIRLCFVSLRVSGNVAPHTSHAYGLMPLCDAMCDLRLPLQLYRIGHSLQTNGLMPVCRNACCRKLPLDLNDFPHSEHRNGVSPLCVRMWSLSVLDCWKAKSEQKKKVKQLLHFETVERGTFLANVTNVRFNVHMFQRNMFGQLNW